MADTPSGLPDMELVWQQTLDWQPNDQQQLQFQRLYQLILEGNRQLNLTRITEPTEFWEKHLWDSLRGVAPLLKSEGKRQRAEVGSVRDGEIGSIGAIPPSPHPPHPSSLKAIDVGTGAGFPGLAIAIARPGWTVTLLDATRKKITFLETLLTDLSLQNTTTLIDRAERVGQDPCYRETYDIALVRAVGAASVCAEYALPLLKVEGLAVLYRGQWTDKDTLALQLVAEKLGGTIESIEKFTTPISQSTRHCLYLRKVVSTPIEFPRLVGLPTQQPL